MSFRRRVVAAIVVAFVLVGAWSSAHAHTSVRRATPGPGETVTAPVAEIRIEFLDPVQPGASIELTAPDGTPVPVAGGPESVAGGSVVVQRFEPIREPGDYRVDHDYTADDGGAQSGSYQFEVVAAGDRGSLFDIGTIAMVATLALVAVAVAVAAIRRRR